MMMRTLIVALVLAAGPVAAAELRVGAGVALADFDSIERVAPAAELGVDLGDDRGAWRLAVAYLGEQDAVDYLGNYGTIGAQWIGGAQAVYFVPFDTWRVEVGAGAAVRSNADHADYLLPSTLNVNLTAGVRAGRWFVELRHLSNGWTRDSNRGQNWLTVGAAF